MASTHDVSTFTSSAQIFSANLSLSQIRSIHSALRAQIEDKAVRLRSQVGGSYRELLGTADTIVQMRADNDRVQGLLVDMGRRCGRKMVSFKAKGLSRLSDQESSPEVCRAVRLKLLDRSLLVFGRVLKGHGGLDATVTRVPRLVLATKVLVLSRLLIKSLGEKTADDGDGHGDGVNRGLEAPRKSIGSMRRRLLGYVRTMLDTADATTPGEDIVGALCVYSLITSSGARDALRHFLAVRAEAMALTLAREDERTSKTADKIVRSLGLYTQSILQVQALVPAKLSPTLAGLKSQPLLADPALGKLDGLYLDLCRRWCSEEIQYYTPFVRHDDLRGEQARDMLADWAAKGSVVVLEGLKQTLDHMAEPGSIIELRTRVLQLWVRNGGRARGFDASEMQNNLRGAINSRILALVESKVSNLRLVGSEIRAALEAWQEGVSDRMAGLWDEDGYDQTLSQDAAPFIHEVTTRLYGRNETVSKAVHCYTAWARIIVGIREALERLRKERWDNDSDEIEDEETLEARQQALSRDDPQELEDRLDAALSKAFEGLEKQLAQLWEEKSKAPASGTMAMYLIRVLRDVRVRLPERPAMGDFGLALVPRLHESVVLRVSAPALSSFATLFPADRQAAGRLLWEGEPPLPKQPSPCVFLFLQELSLAMADAGGDLWSAAAVAVLKRHVCKCLREAWQEGMASVSCSREPDTDDARGGGEGTGRGEGDDDGDGEEKHGMNELTTGDEASDLACQWQFDVSYLQCSVGNLSGAASTHLTALQDELDRQAGLEDGGQSRQRIVKAAEDFWQRTNLLFGFLAQ